MPIQAAAAGRQERVWAKFSNLRTIGASVLDRGGTTAANGWAGRTRRELKTRPGRSAAWEMMERKDGTASWKRYKRLKLWESSRKFRWLASKRANLHVGWKRVLQLRAWNLYTGHTAAKRGAAEETLLRMCPSCEVETPETPRHLVCECERWSRDREDADAYAGVGMAGRREWLQGVGEPAELLCALADDDAERKMV
ncbi:MAG: uncharacterized protein A8A55_2955 [Amphiamblys sp. WSBS2006]|nr:MAG: uncharacterized protein A8A55_2955 [Amphiamblys sp. WSBS2006]